jgi:hypothetical protein
MMFRSKSCTILIEGRVRCIHDGSWYDCDVSVDLVLGAASPSASRRFHHARVVLKSTLLILQEGHEVGDFVRTIEKEWKKLQ